MVGVYSMGAGMRRVIELLPLPRLCTVAPSKPQDHYCHRTKTLVGVRINAGFSHVAHRSRYFRCMLGLYRSLGRISFGQKIAWQRKMVALAVGCVVTLGDVLSSRNLWRACRNVALVGDIWRVCPTDRDVR